MTEPVVRGMIAEDEAPQRERLQAMLAEAWPALQLVAVCADGLEARDAALRERPQVAFLDIRMPGLSGLEVARSVSDSGGLVVFVTGYDSYAVNAFEAGAVDYLIKPIDRKRLQQTVDRVRARLADPAPQSLHALIDHLKAQLEPRAGNAIRWISASVGDSVRMLSVDEVLFFQAQDKYVRVVTADDELIIRTPLKELIEALDGEQFWQVHRSVIVRVAAIERLQRDELGRTRLVLRQHGERLPVSASFLPRFRGM